MKAAGLDLSLTSTGMSIDGETSTVRSRLKAEPRLIEIRDIVVEAVAWKDVVAIEGYSFGSRASQAHSTGELGGQVKVKLHECEIPFVIIPPSNVKKYATGKGNASKDEVVSAVSARTGRTFTGTGANDQCDAWVLEQMVLAFYEPTNALLVPMPKLHLTALDKIEWPPAKLSGLLTS